MDTSNLIPIPLSKTGKHRGKYTAWVDPEDKDLALFNWSVLSSKNTENIYAFRKIYSGDAVTCELLHRVILSRIVTPPLSDTEEVDHIDGDGLNCTRENLRRATKNQNMMNRGLGSRTTTKLKGVSYHLKTGKYQARIGFNKKSIYIGLFDTPELAYQAYCAKADELHEEYANKGK